jgi:hypothetical protein
MGHARKGRLVVALVTIAVVAIFAMEVAIARGADEVKSLFVTTGSAFVTMAAVVAIHAGGGPR